MGGSHRQRKIWKYNVKPKKVVLKIPYGLWGVFGLFYPRNTARVVKFSDFNLLLLLLLLFFYSNSHWSPFFNHSGFWFLVHLKSLNLISVRFVCFFWNILLNIVEIAKQYVTKLKSCIRETKHLSIDSDSSTDVIGGWTKNTQNPIFFKSGKNHKKRKNSETSRNMTKLAIQPLTRGL